MIPASRGYVFEVVFFGRNLILIFENLSLRAGGWQGALSKNSKILRFLRIKVALSRDKTSFTTSVVIHAFELEKYQHLLGLLISFKFLKHLGFAYFPMTMGSSFSPAALTKNAHVLFCLGCFPPLQRRPFSFRLVSGNPRQKLPVSSIFHTSSGFHPRVISLTCSFQLSIVSSFTSPSSPAMVMWCRLCCF